MTMRDNDQPKGQALTNAQRQRRHRDKRRRELQALRAAVSEAVAKGPATDTQEHALQQQVAALTAQLQHQREAAARHLARIDALQAELLADQQAAQALRAAWRGVLVKLTPAAQHVVRAHLQGCGAAQWLSAPDTPAKPARPDTAAPSRAHVSF
ncbi:hypothetical protein [Pseudorhodoferax sp.]|uniref:hypothetical protein n=1 Tax=Pseudorhodoferax sp. TaxID=1993553 RepID=UPI002DD65613|nr:hypothetical protein [Pseudorhodoferax sp.]